MLHVLAVREVDRRINAGEDIPQWMSYLARDNKKERNLAKKVYSKNLQRHLTPAESLLLPHLLDLGFKSQTPIQFKDDNFCIPDFCHHKLKLVVEADGGHHYKQKQKDYDLLRDDRLQEEKNITVIRFSNQDIINNLDLVLTTIKHEVYIRSIKLENRLAHIGKDTKGGGLLSPPGNYSQKANKTRVSL